MLSILIPIYNQDANKLVGKLISQCEAAGIEYLISVYDDKSTKKWKALNAPLNHVFKVNYVELSENLGRAKIRNWLASAAPYPYLLFLDGDSGIVRNDFIKKYVTYLNKADVVYGGTHYSDKPSRSLKRRLHWKYGKFREALPAKERSKHPIMHFHSNNFMITAKVFDRFKFDEKIVGYGYEDLLLGQSIVQAGYNITHIDNPVSHLGLEKTEDFLAKSKDGVHNLYKLQKDGTMSSTKLSNTYHKLQKLGLSKLLDGFYTKFENTINKRLYRENPDLRAFQFMKLYWYHRLYSDDTNKGL